MSAKYQARNWLSLSTGKVLVAFQTALTDGHGTSLSVSDGCRKMDASSQASAKPSKQRGGAREKVKRIFTTATKPKGQRERNEDDVGQHGPNLEHRNIPNQPKTAIDTGYGEDDLWKLARMTLSNRDPKAGERLEKLEIDMRESLTGSFARAESLITQMKSDLKVTSRTLSPEESPIRRNLLKGVSFIVSAKDLFISPARFDPTGASPVVISGLISMLGVSYASTPTARVQTSSS